MADSAVYTGVWRDWEKGGWSGSTITVPANQATLLVAFVSIFVRWSGGHLWGLVAFALHQSRWTGQPCDGLHHQQQILFRNAQSEAHTLWTLAKMFWTWRNKARGVCRRSLLLAVPAAAHLLAISAAGVFSSRILSFGNKVLVNSTACGWLADGVLQFDDTYQDEDTRRKADSLFVSARYTAEKSAEYLATCYEDQASRQSSLCNTYVRPRITSTVNDTAACPFADDTSCVGAAIELDSGFLDSALDLGLNGRPEDRIQVRKVTTCAVHPLEKYATPWGPGQKAYPDPLFGARWKYYYIFTDPDAWLQYNNVSAWFLSGSQPYPLTPVAWWDGINKTDTATNLSALPQKPELAAKSGDQILLVLQNFAIYMGRVDDPWFSATSLNDSRGYGMALPADYPNAWYPDSVVTGLGCTEQYQFCAAADRCGGLKGIYLHDPAYAGVEDLGLSPAQRAAYSVLWKALWATQLWFAVVFLNDRLLLASRLLHSSPLSAPLGPDQWRLEAAHFHDLSMAVLQRRVVEYASPPDVAIRPGVGTRQFVVPPATREEVDLCGNVMTLSPLYASLSLASLLTLLVGGMVVIAVSSLLPDCVFWLRRRHKRRRGCGHEASAKTQAWIESHLFHLDRAVLESRGVGPWEPTDKEIPVFRDPGKMFLLTETEDTAAREALAEAGPEARFSKGGALVLETRYVPVPTQLAE